MLIYNLIKIVMEILVVLIFIIFRKIYQNKMDKIFPCKTLFIFSKYFNSLSEKWGGVEGMR